ncbi:related to SLY41 protein [Serendipita indica DSM 11827]|uniref:Related to SLY41 protein n=1 Tax=Serendipita indica (strain DSM 11827) TaxID=1109443 RepID=G4TUQ5_SERID|nr:related to SLY41 protein [Serendipita indica DSM 11827]
MRVPQPPVVAYGWTPTAPKGGWKDASSSTTSLLGAEASTVRFVLLCCLWYASSALSSNTGKSIMVIFKFPVTLTFVQFGFIAGYCLLLASPVLRLAKLRRPTPAIIRSTLPMAAFQVGGHISSSMAISRIPVSTVHTIKALSPLFTVAAYAMLFGVKYSTSTYVSLLPLTVGVMLACTFDMSASNFLGLLCAFGSAIIFVSSNIFFKKIMPTNSSGLNQPHRLDKINLLFYSSGMAFILMIPIWLYYDLFSLINRWSSGSIVAANRHVVNSGHSVTYYFFANGTVHFLQNIIAFAILATTSPVTYSIASLIKRIAVICIAIAWFSQPVHPVQGLGILLTFGGLWLYNRAKGDVERGEKQARRVEAMRDLAIPVSKEEIPVSIEKIAEGQRPQEQFPVPPTHPRHHAKPSLSHAPHLGQGRHTRTYSREYPPPPLNTTIAANSYDKTKYIFSPPLDGQVAVDPYPSPPKSPPEEVMKQSSVLGLNGKTIWNRRGVSQQYMETVAVR